MRKILLPALVFLNCFFFFGYAQNKSNREGGADKPVYFIPKNHESNLGILKKLSGKSFYKSKSERQHIIDSTWGRGDPLDQKLIIFNTYANAVHDEFDGFISLNLNWDSLYNFYLSKITDSTSRGGFSAIMSHFAYDLKDIHTKAYDSTVVFTPLNPGVPILLLGGFLSVEHFGAVTTMLPDSTTLVLRVVPNHPLGLQPGDIILGYEGIPWKKLVRELLAVDLPMVAYTGGCKTADTYHNLFGAGINWHLFDTIDILKYSTGDTLHLSVLPLLNLNVPPMANNEQLSIPNIPFPDVLSDGCATYGILENTNIGYIFLGQEFPTVNAEVQFYNAVNALKNTDALIIDMRLNYGGWALFNDAFQILFNESLNTLANAFRCSNNSFELCPSKNNSDYFIEGKPPKFYDRPIAVLLGPTCVSDGDITAQRLRYHPMVKFFGASPDASLGFSSYIKNFPGWFLRYSIADAFHLNNPGVYLNRREFPINFTVWHNKDDAAKGKDAVVEKALEWIKNLVFSHELTSDKNYYQPGIDTIKISALLENPNSHQTSSTIFINDSEGNLVDSLALTRTGMAGKSELWEGKIKAPDYEGVFNLSVSAIDKNNASAFTSRNISRFTTAGPVTVDSVAYLKGTNNQISIRPFLRNNGNKMPVKNVSVKLTAIDSMITNINPDEIILEDISPGSMVGASTWCSVSYIDSLSTGYLKIKFEIKSDGWTYWTDSTKAIITGVRGKNNQPSAYSLEQNYPNPFNPSTTISYCIKERTNVNITLFNLIGEKVTTLVNEEKAPGEYQINFSAKGGSASGGNAGTLPSGVYFYRIKAGDFTSVKKMLLLK